MEEKIILHPQAKMKITSLIPDFIHINALDKDGNTTYKMIIQVSKIIRASQSRISENWSDILLENGAGAEIIKCKNKINEFMGNLINPPTFVTTYTKEGKETVNATDDTPVTFGEDKPKGDGSEAPAGAEAGTPPPPDDPGINDIPGTGKTKKGRRSSKSV